MTVSGTVSASPLGGGAADSGLRLRRRIGVPAGVAHCLAQSSSAEAAQEMDAGIAQRLDAAIEQAMTAVNVPGAIVGVWGPDGSYVRAFGVADKATGTPMKTDFYSRIGSVTKTFTVTGVLQLADQGKLGLDDPIAKFIDGVPQGDKITLRQLARMQSGLFNYTDDKAFPGGAFRRPAPSLHSAGTAGLGIRRTQHVPAR